MSILLTGCAGFIGSHAVDYFLERGLKVVGVDSLTYAANMENLKEAMTSPNFTFYEKDITETEEVYTICKAHEVKWIFNFAAETHVDNSINCIDNFVHSNITGVISLLKVCKKSNIKIFHISTDEVYGSIVEGSFSEEDVLNPTNPYSATKAASEHLIKSFSNTYGIKYIIARPSNNFGPRQHSEKLIPKVVECFTRGKKVPIYGDGKNIRDWLYVKDNVRIIFDIWRVSEENKTYNISLSQEIENIEIIKKIAKIMDRDFDTNTKYVKDRLGHDFRYSICNDMLTRLHIDMSTNFVKNLRETVISLKGGEEK